AHAISLSADPWNPYSLPSLSSGFARDPSVGHAFFRRTLPAPDAEGVCGERMRPPSAPLRAAACRLHRRGLAVPETLLVKRLLFAQHVVDRPCQPRRQNAHHLRWPSLLLLLLLPLPRSLTGSQKQTGRLREGPAQVRVADLLAA